MDIKTVKISDFSQHVDQQIKIKGWLYNSRAGGKVQFLVLRDGSAMCQAILEKKEGNEDIFGQVKHLGQESSIIATGTVRADDRSMGGFELAIDDVEIVHETNDYPITPKQHGVEFLMKNRHLHLRSKKQWAIARIRHTIINSIRSYFNDNEFILVDTPIFSPSVGEEEQTLFNVDYFGENVALSQTGQLYLEAAALSHGKAYCFGPTFRAEKSKTRRHLTEFWMVEPEVAFIDLEGIMDLGQGLIHTIISNCLKDRRDELEILERDISKLEAALKPFVHLSYSEAVELLHSEKAKNHLENKLAQKNTRIEELKDNIEQYNTDATNAKKQWQKDKAAQQIQTANEEIAELQKEVENIPHHMELAKNFKWGKDLGGSDESIISELHDQPVFVHRYPREVKAFYMKPDPENPDVVLNIDCLAPEGYGEIIGGSMREEDYNALIQRIENKGFDPENYKWYLDLRKYGSVPHGGFGLGVERTVAWVTGIKHIRETIAYPRMMGKVYP
ncbi:MAG: asparagine--tRNA ligase [Phycisphaerae bacterium]|nr:asparagine--tRNA ligase [Phycisphaerae bacterium]